MAKHASVTLLCSCFLWILSLTTAEDIIADATRVGFRIVQNSQIAGVTIRQCSCKEQKICLAEFKTQALRCVDSCWFSMGKMTSRPQQLRQCVTNQIPLIEDFIGCLETNIRSCFPTQQGPQIPKADIRKLIIMGEEKLTAQESSMMDSAAFAPFRPLMDVMVDFGHCARDCFLRENAAGFCTDRLGCQPLIREDRTRKTIKKCMRTVKWKDAAGEFCTCAMNAGIAQLSNVCPMLNLMARKIRINRDTGSREVEPRGAQLESRN